MTRDDIEKVRERLGSRHMVNEVCDLAVAGLDAGEREREIVLAGVHRMDTPSPGAQEEPSKSSADAIRQAFEEYRPAMQDLADEEPHKPPSPVAPASELVERLRAIVRLPHFAECNLTALEEAAAALTRLQEDVVAQAQAARVMEVGCIDNFKKLQASTQREAALREALKDVRAAIIEHAPDTLWAGTIETAVDRIDAALGPSDRGEW